MRQRIKELLIDRSTVEEFRFVLRCMECGREWTSPPVRFSKAGIQPESEGKRVIFQTLYRREWESARERRPQQRGRPLISAPSADGWSATTVSWCVTIWTCVRPVPDGYRSRVSWS